MNNRHPKTARRPASAPLIPLFLALILLLLAPPASSHAQDMLIINAVVHTVTGKTHEPGQVRVRDGHIVAVGTNLTRDTTNVVDLAGLHLYPGIIALNTSLGLVEINAVRASVDIQEVGAFTPDVRSWLSVNPDSELIPVARANGITHAETVPLGGILSGQSGVIALDGWTVEEMAVRTPAGLHLKWPSLNLDTRPKEALTDKSRHKTLEKQAEERRANLKNIHDFFLEARAYENARLAAATDPDFPKIPAWEAVRPFLAGLVPLMIQADEVRQIESAVEWAHTNHYSMVLYGGRDAWMVADRLAELKVPVVYDHVYTQPARDTSSFDVHFRAPAVLHKAGVKVAFSLEGSEPSSLRNLPYAAAQAMAYGLPREEALKGITLYPAQILGLDSRLGSIESGKEASFFASNGDPLDIRSQVKRLWIAGRERSLDSRHTRLYEKYRNRPRGK